MSEPKKFVRMHLLPHTLVGDAVDSNLTPALGTINTKFLHAVEADALKFVKGISSDNEKYEHRTIWYNFEIEYHQNDDKYPEVFPSKLRAMYGSYKLGKNNSWVKR